MNKPSIEAHQKAPVLQVRDISSDPPKEYDYGMKDVRLSDPARIWQISVLQRINQFLQHNLAISEDRPAVTG